MVLRCSCRFDRCVLDFCWRFLVSSTAIVGDVFVGHLDNYSPRDYAQDSFGSGWPALWVSIQIVWWVFLDIGPKIMETPRID